MRGGQASLFPFYSSGFTSPDIPSRRQRTKRAHPVLKLWLVTCFWCVLHPKSGFTSQFFFSRTVKSKNKKGRKKRQRTYAPDAHNLSESCHVSSLSDPSLSHHAYQNATWAWHVPAIAGKCTVSLSRLQADRFTARQTHRPVPKHQTRTTCRSSYEKHHTYTKSSMSPTRKFTCVR